jgi:hypothetical protein
MRRNHQRFDTLSRQCAVRTAFILCVLAASTVLGQNSDSSSNNSARTRPIQDFLSTQTNAFPDVNAA